MDLPICYSLDFVIHQRYMRNRIHRNCLGFVLFISLCTLGMLADIAILYIFEQKFYVFLHRTRCKYTKLDRKKKRTIHKAIQCDLIFLLFMVFGALAISVSLRYVLLFCCCKKKRDSSFCRSTPFRCCVPSAMKKLFRDGSHTLKNVCRYIDWQIYRNRLSSFTRPENPAISFI